MPSIHGLLSIIKHMQSVLFFSLSFFSFMSFASSLTCSSVDVKNSNVHNSTWAMDNLEIIISNVKLYRSLSNRSTLIASFNLFGQSYTKSNNQIRMYILLKVNFCKYTFLHEEYWPDQIVRCNPLPTILMCLILVDPADLYKSF